MISALSGVANRNQQLHVSSSPFIFFSSNCLPFSSGLSHLLLLASWFERVCEQITSNFWMLVPLAIRIFHPNYLFKGCAGTSSSPPPSPFSSKPANTDVTLSGCSQLIHQHGTGDLLDAKQLDLLYLTTASSCLYSGWRWGAIFRPIVKTDQQSIFLSLGSTFGLYFYTLSHTFIWHWKTWLITSVVFAVCDFKDEMPEWNVVG